MEGNRRAERMRGGKKETERERERETERGREGRSKEDAIYRVNVIDPMSPTQSLIDVAFFTW